MSDFFHEVASLYKRSPNLLCVIAALFILSLDLVTGENIHFPIFFAVPVGLAAWQLNRSLAFAMAILLPMIRVGYFYTFNEIEVDVNAVVNSLINIAALSTFAYLTIRFVSEKRELERRLRQFE